MRCGPSTPLPAALICGTVHAKRRRHDALLRAEKCRFYTTSVPPIHHRILGKILFGKMLSAVYPNIGPHKNMNHTASGLYLLR